MELGKVEWTKVREAVTKILSFESQSLVGNALQKEMLIHRVRHTHDCSSLIRDVILPKQAMHSWQFQGSLMNC